GIIGGGVSGLTLASILEKNHIDYTIFEAENRVGKKILLTGNGKCNLTNTNISNDKYNTDVTPILNINVVDYLNKFGLVTRNIDNRIYPYSESANDVVNFFIKNIDINKVKLNTLVTSIEYDNDTYCINGEKFTHVAICTGSNATIGHNSHNLLNKFNHKITNLNPSLVPLKSNDLFLKALSGIRVKCNLKLYKDNKCLFSEYGELLFKNDGISGIVSMQGSKVFARENISINSSYASIDFAPDIDEKTLNEIIQKNGLDSLLRKAIVVEINKQAEQRKLDIIAVVKDFRVNLIDTYGIKNAQVVSGGLDIRGFKDLVESKLSPSLYACGEVLDVDGECGGYNINFAIASAILTAKKLGVKYD
ncbi:MAG: aminoacetone oxidase family FAD-binding enzyme, partial [Clostridia bacterium]|nr:aminoacetone oxidase family FAD-binding enzyme [Clostridia bacterium]